METATKKPKITHSVYMTSDYDIFKSMAGNRKIDEHNLNRLVRSFKNKYLFSPILVNEDMEIIDGQHRFAAAKRLHFPIYYIIADGYGRKEVQILNTNSSNWKKVDYLRSFSEIGEPAYIEMKKFMDKYKMFGIAVAEQLLSGYVRGMNQPDKGTGDQKLSKRFQEGKLVIPDLEASYEKAEKLLMFAPYYDGYTRKTFVAAFQSFLQHKNYDHNEMIAKLKMNPSALTHCTSVTQYKLVLEEIFNFKRRIKVSLRY